MEYTKLGNTGMDVSQICLGCMGFGDATRWIHKWVLDEVPRSQAPFWHRRLSWL